MPVTQHFTVEINNMPNSQSLNFYQSANLEFVQQSVVHTPHNVRSAQIGLRMGLVAQTAGRVCIVLAALWLACTAAVSAQEIAIEQPSGTNLIGNRVVGFGANNLGQTTIPASLTGVIAIEAGEASSAALKLDGSVVGWGQVNNLPVFTGVKAITVSGFYGHGLKDDGSLVNWGGAPIIPNSNTNLAVSAGKGWSAALQSNTGIVTWGFGLPTAPVETGFVALSAGDFHLLALRNNGTVAAYGNNSDGQTVVPADLGQVRAVAAGRRFSLAITDNFTVRSWGFNDNGGGNNTPVPAGLGGVAAIAANGHALALKFDGTVVGWGRGVEGQLTLPAGSGRVRAIAAGGEHSLALVGSTLSYGAQLVGSPSVAKTFVIKNTGTLPLNISGVNMFGAQSGDFVINTAGLLSSVPAGGQTGFSVRFLPTATGERRGMLRVINNDSDEASFETLLDGSGFTEPDIDVRGNGVSISNGDNTPSFTDFTDFGEVRLGVGDLTRTYTISNLGNAALSVGAVEVSGPSAADFVVTLTPAGQVLPGGSTLVNVRFIPGGPGLRQAAIRINNDDVDERPFDFAIQGFGFNPEIAVSSEGNNISDGNVSPVDFGAVNTTGATVVRSFTIDNLGAGTLSISSITLSGAHASDYSVISAPPASIATGSSGTFQIRFDPSAMGARNARLSFANNDLDENPFDFPLTGLGLALEISVLGNNVEIVDGDSTPSATDLTNFGPLPLSYELVREFVIRHDGNSGQLNVGSVTFTGAAATDFSVRGAPAASLAPGESTILRVAFAPTALGTRNATMNIANNDLDENPYDFALRGSTRNEEISIEHQGTPLVHAGVIAWGNNEQGQLNVPPGLMGVAELDGGFGYTLARRADGTVVAWGRNDFGQTDVPVNLRAIVAISASRFHGLALRVDGTVVAWGRNDSGQGNVSQLRGIKAIAAGDEQTFAVQNDGTVLAFGANHFNQLQVPIGLTDVVQVAAGWGHTLALKRDGTVVCWGRNQQQECSVPAGLNNVTAISAGFANSFALRANGTVVAWGENDHNEIAGAQAMSGITALNAGAHHILARNTDGVLSPWGWNEDGQASVPASIAPNAAASVRALAGGEKHSVAAINPALRFAPGENGAANAKTLIIRNTGSEPLFIDSIAIVGSNASDFSLDASGVPPSIGTSQQASLTVRSNATGGDPRRATLRIVNSDHDEQQFEIALYAEFAVEIAVSGNGVDIANGDSTPSLGDHTDFGSIQQDTSFTRTFTIRNSGSGNLRLGTPTLESPFEIIQMPPAVIAGGSSGSFQVRFFLPPIFTPRLFETAISFASNDADESPFTFALRAHSRIPGTGDFAGGNTPVTGVAVYASALQASGHGLLGGEFSQVHGQPRQNLARLNPDGSLDPGFSPSANGAVRSIAAMVNGQVLIAGEFTHINGVPRRYVARLNADGTLDTSFDPNPSAPVDQVLVDRSERILLAGNFLSLQPGGSGAISARPYLARVLAGGAVDSAFYPAPDGRVRAIALQDNDRMVLAGDFLMLAPNGGAAVARSRIARIFEDGALDTSLDASANGSVRTVAISARGAIMLGGDFTTVAAAGSAPLVLRHFAFLDTNGSLRPDYDPAPNGPVWTIVLSNSQRVFLGGAFNRFEPGGGNVYERVGFAQISNGSPTDDAVANVGLASGTPLVATIALGTNRTLLLGGRFDSLTPNGDAEPTSRSHLARLLNYQAGDELRVLNGGGVIRFNGGDGSPNLRSVSFEYSTDAGSSWTSLGNGVRQSVFATFDVPAPVPLPTALRVRARGTAASGANTSQIELITDFDFSTGPRMEVRGNDVVIRNFDSTPSGADHTDFGGISASSGFIDRSYTIRNFGAQALQLGSFSLSGANAADFSSLNTLPASLTPGASTTLQIRFDPSAVGTRAARVRFFSNDPLASPFEFSIQGSGLGELPGAPILQSAVPLNSAARLSFSAPANGGSPILDYTASCIPGTASNTQNALTIDVAGLTNNISYQCLVRARNAAGTGPASNALSVIPNAAPTLTPVAVTRSQGSTGTGVAIATVSDDGGAAALVLTINGDSSATSNGVTISNLLNNNGNVSATIAATCTATSANFSLRATDVPGGFTDASLSLTISPNTPPMLSYASRSAVVGETLNINPSAGPNDNGSISSVDLQSVGSYSGGASVATNAQITLSNARPVGNHSLTIRATDNCAAFTDANVPITISIAQTTATITSAMPNPSLQGQGVLVRFNVTANAPSSGTPTGNVVISDGVNSCNSTVAVGQCTLALSTLGNRTLSASYAGSADYAGSSGTTQHMVLSEVVFRNGFED
jgi:alpha-tubulin suppressor-like RCC1 family protein